MEKIEGFKITFDKNPDKWRGSIYLKSPYKSLSEYVSSSKESCAEAISEIFNRYSHKEIEGIDLKQVREIQSELGQKK
jgi:hypothetical protein